VLAGSPAEIRSGAEAADCSAASCPLRRSRSGGWCRHASDDRRQTTSSEPLKKAAIRAGPAGSNPLRGAAPHLSSDRSPGLGDSAVNILCRSRPPRRISVQRLKVAEAADRRTAARSPIPVGGACSKTPPRITLRDVRFPRLSEGRTHMVKNFYIVNVDLAPARADHLLVEPRKRPWCASSAVGADPLPSVFSRTNARQPGP
jgi:hypothetical protein